MRWPSIISNRNRRQTRRAPDAGQARGGKRDAFYTWLAEYRQKLDRVAHQSEKTSKEDKEKV